MNQNIAYITLLVRDYDEAIQYYTEKLNFELIEDMAQPELNRRFVVISPKGSKSSTILLAKASKEQEHLVGNQCKSSVFLILSTDDFYRDYNLLIKNDIEIVKDPVKAPYGTVAIFKDLYGNLWDFIEFSNDHSMKDRF